MSSDLMTGKPAESIWARMSRSPWFGFAVRRAGSLLTSVLVLVVVTFLIVQLIPGDPALAVAGADATAADIERVRTELGLDLSIWQQFVNYVGGLLTGDLGNSFTWGVSVSSVLAARLPFTVSIALVAMALMLVIAVPLGMAVSVLTRGGRRKTVDLVFGVVTGFLSSVPGYVIATLLVVLFAIVFRVLPPAYSAQSGLASYPLPIIALAIGPACTIARVVRREMSAVLEQDYIRTARGWRLRPARVYLRYALPNLLTTTLTLSGLILAGMFGGAIVIESVFAWPGLGSGVVAAILNRDYPVIQGIVLVIGLLATVVNLVVDLALALIDPRSLGGNNDGL